MKITLISTQIKFIPLFKLQEEQPIHFTENEIEGHIRMKSQNLLEFKFEFNDEGYETIFDMKLNTLVEPNDNTFTISGFELIKIGDRQGIFTASLTKVGNEGATYHFKILGRIQGQLPIGVPLMIAPGA